jgi:gas vesicle protein
MSENNVGNNLLYFLAGMAAGAVGALLFAPQSGEKTRKLLNKKADEGREYLREKGEEIREQAEEYVEKGKELISEQVERGKDLVSHQVERGKDLVAKQKEQLSAALDAVKDGYKEAKRSH